MIMALRELNHPNVLPFLGLDHDADRGIATVSPWLENGNVVQYLARNPGVDRPKLVSIEL